MRVFIQTLKTRESSSDWFIPTASADVYTSTLAQYCLLCKLVLDCSSHNINAIWEVSWILCTVYVCISTYRKSAPCSFESTESMYEFVYRNSSLVDLLTIYNSHHWVKAIFPRRLPVQNQNWYHFRHLMCSQLMKSYKISLLILLLYPNSLKSSSTQKMSFPSCSFSWMLFSLCTLNLSLRLLLKSIICDIT